MELVQKVLKGDSMSLGRVISMVESGDSEIREIMKSIYTNTGKAHRVGITGPPGVGKSMLIDRLIALIRGEGLTVGIIAADPTSPFSGGAVLGDRIRMQEHYLDSGVFIRSMATRDAIGLPCNIGKVISILEASGKDIILVETVGVGQTEIDIMTTTDTVVVVLSPGFGNSIQSIKAGLFEIAHILVVNKADYPSSANTIHDMQAMLELQEKQQSWQIPLVATEAINNVGIQTLYKQIKRHYQFLNETNKLSEERQKQRLNKFSRAIEQKIAKELRAVIKESEQLGDYIQRVQRGEIDPYLAADEVLESEVFLTALPNYLLERMHSQKS